MHELLAKYREMSAMRADHDAGRDPDPRARMRALAARFPGALREIDELPAAMIEVRIAELEATLAGSRPPLWARAMADYHAWMRAALALRRHAGRLRDRDAALAWIETGYRPGEGAPSSLELIAVVEHVLHPPEGRLNRWIFAHLAPRHGLSAAELESAIFPPSPRRARSR